MDTYFYSIMLPGFKFADGFIETDKKGKEAILDIRERIANDHKIDSKTFVVLCINKI